MKIRSAHILAFGATAWSTLAGFEFAIRTAKEAGYDTFVVLPMLFEQGGLTKEDVVEIAKRYHMKLTSCGFLPGDKFSPYTEAGRGLSIKELRTQFLWQTYFYSHRVGSREVCGPVFDAWRADQSTFKEDGFRKYAEALVDLLAEMNLVLSVEIVNAKESSIPEAHVKIPKMIYYLGSNLVKLHADIVHLASYLGMENVIDFLNQHADIIRVVELGMPGREIMRKVPEFLAIATELFDFLKRLLPDVPVAVEQFDFATVIKAFGLEDIYSSRIPGLEAFHDDAIYLESQGMLPA